MAQPWELCWICRLLYGMKMEMNWTVPPQREIMTDIILSSDTLTIGNTYYISVDDSQIKGTFSLCVDADPLDAELVGTNVPVMGQLMEPSL